MGITEILAEYNQKLLEHSSSFFAWYNITGRKVLDSLHTLFDNAFYVMLYIAVAVSLIYFVMAFYSLFYKPKKSAKETAKDSELPFVTIQIPTYNELVAIRCAQRCLEFDYPKEKYEILIGDDSNKPEVSRQISDFAKTSRHIKVFKRETNVGYKPANLNNLLKHSKGEVLVIFDSDFIPEPDFLRRIVQPFVTDKKIAGVQARWKLINYGQNFISALGATIILTYHYINMPFMKRRKITFLCGSAEAVRKDLLIKYGGWESGNLTEDIEYSLRIYADGHKIEYLEDLECGCEVPYTLKDLYRQQMRWAYGVIYSWKKHFGKVMKSSHLNFVDKFYMLIIFCSGYLISVLLGGLFLTGTLSLITHPPAPVEWGRFFYEMARNIILTSGLIVTSILALIKSRKTSLTLKMVASSFSFGLVVTYYVNIGIFKAITKIPMEWYMLNKQGNKLVQNS
ncbi:MAG TPA: glycosyltransferase [Candidatus Nanoarchaeia archaeon]|nr:glycosyltransferase [Candidatus Nanoarchaeia archaeon]